MRGSCWITRLKKRDRTVWATVYDANASDLYVFIAQLASGNREVAAELNQNTWLAALDSIDQFSAERGEFRQWLFGIARKQVVLFYRRRARMVQMISTSRSSAEFADGAILPPDVLEQVEGVCVVRAALAELSSEGRQLLLDKYANNLSVKEIACRMGRTPKAVESALSRARSRMRELLHWYLNVDGVETEE